MEFCSRWACKLDRVGGCVGRSWAQATRGWRRHDQMVTGVAPATRFCGGGHGCTAAASYGARGGKRKAPGGAQAHQEHSGEDGEPRGGIERPELGSPAAECCGKAR